MATSIPAEHSPPHTPFPEEAHNQDGERFSESVDLSKNPGSGSRSRISPTPVENHNTDQAGAMANPHTSTNAAEGLDRLLQRMKSDVMFELRHLQHGERPVTGQGHRDNLQQFMLKHSGHDKENAPANVDTVEEHRPEAVVVEVQGMIERRPVSSVLQSASFRRQLENIIRSGLTSTSRNNRNSNTSGTSRQQQQLARQTVPIRPPIRPSRSIDTRGSPSSEASAAPSPTPSVRTGRIEPRESRNEGLTIGTLPEQPTLTRSESTESIDSFSSARSSTEQDLDDVDLAEGVETTQGPTASLDERVPPPPPLPRSIFDGERPSQPQNEPNESGVGITWNEIGQIHREELVQEISELLHSRLVSSTLDSEFRATLELHTQERLQASGVNGRAVQDFVRSLPRQGVPRNDFSHMGIPAGGAGFGGIEDNWDNVSVTSVSAHSVPYVQTNTYLSREIQGLKAQITEMKSMLKLTFDLQIDIQRSIRQEVAAALNNFTASNGATGLSHQPPCSRPVNDTHCLICLDKHSDSVLYQCGHMCVCYSCGRDLVSRGHNCPVCRAPIRDVIRAYRTNSE